MYVIGGLIALVTLVVWLARLYVGRSAEELLTDAEDRVKFGPRLDVADCLALLFAVADEIHDTDPRAAALLREAPRRWPAGTLREDASAKAAPALSLLVLAANDGVSPKAAALLDRLWAVLVAREPKIVRVLDDAARRVQTGPPFTAEDCRFVLQEVASEIEVRDPHLAAILRESPSAWFREAGGNILLTEAPAMSVGMLAGLRGMSPETEALLGRLWGVLVIKRGSL